MDLLPIYVYYGLFLMLTAHGLHRALLCLRLLRSPRRPDVEAPVPARIPDSDLPLVTVQIPLFNELYVAEAVIGAVAALDWPEDRLEIQVLDDSTDETSRVVERLVNRLRTEGRAVHHVRRVDRQGFKAGALALGLRGDATVQPARGEYVAIFDADFLPRPDFLRRTVPSLVQDPGLAVVQARWEHVNREHSLLTRLQAVFLDAHFAVEHEARQRAGHFLNFNGTAGVWRRSAIDASGGWSHDTLTEDLDLSFRAQMAGLRFRYLHDVGVPSELPIEMNAFKSQQRRWAKGSIETARKLLPRLLRRRELRLATRIEGAFHLVNNIAYVIIFLVSLLALPVASMRVTTDRLWTAWFDLYLIGFGILPVISYFILGQLRVGRGFWRSLLLMPPALAVGIGISLSNAGAVLEALAGQRTSFVRTPKYRVGNTKESWVGKRYLAARNLMPLLEVLLGLSCSGAVLIALLHRNIPFAVLASLFASGYLYVGISSLLPGLSERARRRLTGLRSWQDALEGAPVRATEQPRGSSV